MKHYETIFIIKPNLGDEEYGEVLSKFRDLIDQLNGVTVKVEEWGKQKLAYRLKKFDSGIYVLVDHCGDPGMIVEMARNLKLDERILKYQTVKLADKADPDALIREEKEAKEKRPVKAAEGLSGREEGPSKAGEAPAKAEEVGPSTGGEESAKADKVPIEAAEVSAKAEEVGPSTGGEESAKADEVPAEAEEVGPSTGGEESAKATEVSAKAAEAPAKADEAPAEADEAPAKADEVPQEKTDVKKEGEKES